MKTFAGIAAIAVTASTVSAFDPEFLRGAQTGMFLTSEEQFQDYECETPKPDAKIQQYIDMVAPMMMMMKNMNKVDNLMMDNALEAIQAFGKISAVFDENYEGGEFCKGLLFSKELSRLQDRQRHDEPEEG